MKPLTTICGDSNQALRAVGAAILVCLSSTTVDAFDYHPLEIGNEWFHQNAIQETLHMTIIGEQEILGTMTIVRRSEEELPDPQIYDAFLTSDEAGNLFLHGAVNHTYPFEMAYLPPILLVSVPLELGQYWVTEGVQAYDFDGVPIGVPFDYALQVDFEGNVAVPAGTFYAYGIGAVIPGQPNLPHEQNHDIFGRYIPFEEDARDIDITHWYTDQVGLVQRTFYLGDERVLKLLWWTPPTATEERTWGQIKGMYR